MNIIELPSRHRMEHRLVQCTCEPKRYKYVCDDDGLPSSYSMDAETNRVLHFDPPGGPYIDIGSEVGGKYVATIELTARGTYVYLGDTVEEAVEICNSRAAMETTTSGGGCLTVSGDAKEKSEPISLPVVIGMIGKAGSGKDTVADYIVEKYGFEKLAFADPLKKAVQVMFDIDDHHMFDRELREVELEDWSPWSVRKLLQFVGTNLMRNQVDEDIWMKNAISRVKKMKLAVLSDVRFPNECDGVRNRLKGLAETLFIRVTRPGHEDAQGGMANHESEAFIDELDADIDILNDATIADLYEKIDAIMDKILETQEE